MGKTAIDFVLYGYFGISTDDCDADIFNAAIDRAFSDATMRAAFVVDGLDKGEKKEIRCVIRVYGKEVVRESVYNLLNKNYGDGKFRLKNKKIKDIDISGYIVENMAYDVWHKALCSNLVELCGRIIGEEPNKEPNKVYFSIGNAQKWVNMTMKNLYVISGLISLEKEWCQQIISMSKEFHIPLDSYIFKAIKNDLEIKPELKCSNGKLDTWSKIEDYKSYENYQANVKKKVHENNDISMIDWEGPEWIEQAKTEKIKDMKKDYKKYYSCEEWKCK